jgi:hypothetical protein
VARRSACLRRPRQDTGQLGGRGEACYAAPEVLALRAPEYYAAITAGLARGLSAPGLAHELALTTPLSHVDAEELVRRAMLAMPTPLLDRDPSDTGSEAERDEP